MKNKGLILKTVIIIIIVLIIILGIYLILKDKNESTNNKLSSSINDIDIEVNTDDGEQKIVWTNYEEADVELTKSLEITQNGIYNLTGTIEDGYIRVNTSGNVKLILNNVSITNSKGPAIIIESAENVIIELADGSNNYLEDTSTYTGYDEDVNGTIYSKDDIVFQGTGTLNIKANYEDGIVGKDDLKIISGTYNIVSNDDGIRGKDSVYIVDGTFNIESGGDGIKSTNDTDEEKGFILIENGSFNIIADLDGIQAETKLIIKDGNFTITTGGGSSNASTVSSSWGMWGNSSSADTDSAKGLKAADNLVIQGGNFTLDTSDDSIHSNNYVGIECGTIEIKSGDDGIHADTEIIIDGSETNINISKSYEGIEAAKITINNGNIKIFSSDDGINVAGGNDSSSMNRIGSNTYTENTTNILIINDGTIYVCSSGDGIDVNGSAYIYGGEISVDGPSDSSNGALDYDGEFVVNGGTLIAVGSSGMVQGISSNSTQYNVMINLTSNYSSGKVIKILDSSGNEIISYTPTKSYSSIVISSSELKKGETYKVNIDGTDYTTFTISSISTTIGNTMNNGMNGGMNSGGMSSGGNKGGIKQNM